MQPDSSDARELSTGAAEGATVPPLLRVRAPARAFVVPWLIGANVAVFLAMLAAGVAPMMPGEHELLDWGANSGELVARGEWWRLATCGFIHAGIVHIGFNMFSLRSLGVVERLYGNGAFLVLYLASLLGGSIASVLWRPSGSSVGASGAVFGVAGALLAFFLRHRRAMPNEVFRRMTGNLVTILGLNVMFGFIVENIDNGAHIGGLLTGCAAGFALDRDPEGAPGLDRRRLARVSLVLLVLLALAAWIPRRVEGSPTVAAAALVRRAQEALEREDWEAVDALATEAIEAEPENARAHELRAIARLSTDDEEGGIADLGRALDLDPDMPRALAIRGQVRWRNGDLQGASADFEQLVDLLHPKDAHVGFALRGMLAYARRDWRAASKDFDRILRAAPAGEVGDGDEVQVLDWLARARLGERADAEREALALLAEVRAGKRETNQRSELELIAREISPEAFARKLDARGAETSEPSWAWFVLGSVELLDGREDRARDAFQKAILASRGAGETALLARAELEALDG